MMQGEGMATAQAEYVFVPVQIWSHVELITMMLHQCIWHLQTPQQFGSDPGAAGGCRCQCGCVVYPARHADETQRHREEQPGPTKPARAELDSQSWHAWRKGVRAGSGPFCVPECAATTENSFAALSEDELEEMGDDGPGECDSCPNTPGVLGVKAPTTEQSDDEMLDQAIAEAKAARAIVYEPSRSANLGFGMHGKATAQQDGVCADGLVVDDVSKDPTMKSTLLCSPCERSGSTDDTRTNGGDDDEDGNKGRSVEDDHTIQWGDSRCRQLMEQRKWLQLDLSAGRLEATEAAARIQKLDDRLSAIRFR